ncbi:MAG: hypothetical protein ACKVZJ_02745 [Phycisphaerales bacterium]
MSPNAKLLLVLFVIAGVVGAIVAVIIASARAAAKKRAELVALAASFGLTYLPKGDKAFVKAWSIVKPLSKNGTAKHVLYGTLNSGLTLTVFEHQYAVSTGKSVHVITHSVFAVESPDWPKVSLQRRGMVAKWFLDLMGGNRDQPDDDEPEGPPGFARNWAILTDDPAFADHMLTPELRAVIDGAEKVPWWWFDGGKVTVLIGSALTAEVFRRGVELIEAACAVLPADLREAAQSHRAELPPADEYLSM